MAERQPILIIVVGKKGVGKTYRTLLYIGECLRGYPSTGAEGRKVLVFDVNDEFTTIKPISMHEVKAFSRGSVIEARRVRIFKEKKDGGGKMNISEMRDTLQYILENYHDGLLLVEDVTKYVSDSLPSDLIGSLCTQRHVGCDIIIHFQTIGKAGNPKIVGNMNQIRMHKMSDNVGRHKDKFLQYTEPLELLEILIDLKCKENKYFYAYFDVDYIKIRGEYSKADLLKAIEIYLETNYKQKVVPAKNRVSLSSGDKKFKDHKILITTLMKDMFFKYYGND